MYILSIAAFKQKWQSWVQQTLAKKPKLFTPWPFADTVCWPCFKHLFPSCWVTATLFFQGHGQVNVHARKVTQEQNVIAANLATRVTQPVSAVTAVRLAAWMRTRAQSLVSARYVELKLPLSFLWGFWEKDNIPLAQMVSSWAKQQGVGRTPHFLHTFLRSATVCWPQYVGYVLGLRWAPGFLFWCLWAMAVYFPEKFLLLPPWNQTLHFLGLDYHFLYDIVFQFYVWRRTRNTLNF